MHGFEGKIGSEHETEKRGSDVKISSFVSNGKINNEDLRLSKIDDSLKTSDHLDEVREKIRQMNDSPAVPLAAEAGNQKFDKNKSEGSSLFARLRNSSFLRRLTLASMLTGSGLLLSQKTTAADKMSRDNFYSTIVSGEQERDTVDDIEQARKQENMKKNFFKIFNSLIDSNNLNPESNILKRWEAGAKSFNYYNEHLAVDCDTITNDETKPLRYLDVSITRHESDGDSSDGTILNFDISDASDGETKTIVRYNKLLSGEDVFAVRVSYKKKPGFKKITAREFENQYQIVVTKPGYREDMDHHYVWIDETMDSEKVINGFMSDLQNLSIGGSK